jgi:p-aminobenzoyl-glutamate transporter AbgT
MRKQKLLTVLFCCALLIGISTVTASAQELAGTAYRLFIYPSESAAFNANAVFQSDGVLIIGIGSGVGAYLEFAPTFVGLYHALGVTMGDKTGDITMLMVGTTVNQGKYIVGFGSSIFSGDRVPFWFYGTLIVTAE